MAKRSNKKLMGKNEETKRVSPKLVEMCKLDWIGDINKKLDNGESPNEVCIWINKKGFKISRPLIYDYQKLRKRALTEGITIEHMISPVERKVVDKNDPATVISRNKLKSEIDALDKIIQGGYDTLLDWDDRPISPKTMMEAIKLKNELTDGAHGFLTTYGMEQLRDIEAKKYQLIIEHLISYIPKTRQQEAVDRIAEIEDEYYRGTDYYEEYIQALEISDADKKKKLEEYYKEEDKQPNTNGTPEE